MLAAGWDQCAFNAVLSPAAAVAEEVGRWLAQGAARHPGRRLGRLRHRRAGGQHRRPRRRPATTCSPRPAGTSSRDGLLGAPRVRVRRRRRAARDHRPLAAAARPRHRRDRAGRGRRQRRRSTSPTCARVLGRADRPGRRSSACRPATSTPAPATTCAPPSALAHEHGAWVHVDGAFGLWAAASPAARAPGRRRRAGRLVGLRRPQVAQRALRLRLRVLPRTRRCTPSRDVLHRGLPRSARAASAGGPSDFTAGVVRRARGFAVWAALRELGRDGVAELVDGCCALARTVRRRAGRRRRRGRQRRGAQPGAGRLRRRRRAPTPSSRRVQRDGTCWLGGTTWRGRRLMRISVSNWSTTEEDVDLSVEAVLRVAAAV